MDWYEDVNLMGLMESEPSGVCEICGEPCDDDLCARCSLDVEHTNDP